MNTYPQGIVVRWPVGNDAETYSESFHTEVFFEMHDSPALDLRGTDTEGKLFVLIMTCGWTWQSTHGLDFSTIG